MIAAASHTVENRWTFAETFDFHPQLGRRRSATWIATFPERLGAGVRELPRVRLVSPDEAELRSVLICFGIARGDPERAVERRRLHGGHLNITPQSDVVPRGGCRLCVGQRAIAPRSAVTADLCRR